MDSSSPDRSYGVFKPVGHLVVSFPQAAQAGQALDRLVEQGCAKDRIARYTDREMLEQIDRDLEDASILASLGQEKNLVKAHRALAEQGYHWLVVPAEDREQAQQLADTVAGCGAERAQYYGHLIIEEMIEHGDELSQVAESPDRRLDAQTASGREQERAQLRPGEPQGKPH